MRIICFVMSLFFVCQVMAFNSSDLRTLGKNAPVQLYLFTSLSCSHCSDFHKNILPTLKKEYADSGKAQVIIVDMVSSGNNLMATQVMRCLNKERGFKLENDLYAHQSKWAFEEPAEAKKVIASYAMQQGMTQQSLNACLTNKKLQESIIEQQANLARLYGITGTPTLVMRNGTEVHKWPGSDKKVFEELEEVFAK